MSACKKYELSHAQKRLLFIEQLEVGKAMYNIGSAFILKGDLQKDLFEKAIQRIIARHGTLRTFFGFSNGDPVQFVMDEVEFKIVYGDLTFLSGDGLQQKVEELVNAEVEIPFDLTVAPLLRVKLYKLSEREHLCLLTIHHIISDGWSMDVFTHELVEIYSALLENREDFLEDLDIQYVDYAYWFNNLLEYGELNDQRGYWLNKLAGELPDLDFPLDFPRPPMQSFEGDIAPVTINEELTRKIEKISQDQSVSLYMFLLTAFHVLLAKYTRTDDIIIGSSVSGRIHPDVKGLIGFFVNTLPIRNKVSADDTFRKLLGRCKKTILEVYDNQEYPFDKIVEEIGVERDLSHSPIYDIIFEFHSWDNDKQPEKNEKTNLIFERYEQKIENSIFDFSVELVQNLQGIGGYIQYCTALFKRSTMEKMFERYRKVLEQVVDNIDLPLSQIQLLEQEEIDELLVRFNYHQREYPVDQPYAQLFEEQVRKTPDRIAVTFKDQELSYQQLNEKANQLARFLQERGIQRNDFVAILNERNIDMLVGILATFKAGGVYVPIDVTFPDNRIDYILENSGVSIVLTDSNILDRVRQLSVSPSLQEIMCFDHLKLGGYSAENLPLANQSRDLAYMIYTSGSTGMPKGTLIRHDGMVNHLFIKIEDLSLTERDIVLQNASPCFDISIWQFLSALIVGGKTVIVPFEVSSDPSLLFEEVRSNQVTIMETVPSLLFAFIDTMKRKSVEERQLSHVRWLLVTGEELPVRLVTLWFEYYPEIKMVNAYGPTEASDDITHQIITEAPKPDQEKMPIGRPLYNLKIYLVDRFGQLVPVGVKGEIWVSGIGVGGGYWKNEEKTAQHFIKDPFSDDPEAMVYRTGDLGCWLPDGTIEFFGRMDHQVKVRGYRIELGEIENVLGTYPLIGEAAVITKKNNNDNMLIAYYTSSKENMDVGELKNYLEKRLPGYMVPAYFSQLDQMPLLPSGKINRKYLTKLDLDSLATQGVYLPPETEVETRLAAIWSEILQFDKIGRKDNFFEIGGHSILAVKLINRVKDSFKLDLSIRKFFLIPTIEQLASYIEEKMKKEEQGRAVDHPLVKVEEREYYELAPVQLPEWYLHQLEPENSFYNISFELIFHGDMDTRAFEQAWQTLVERHVVFRTYFSDQNGSPVQKVYPKVDMKLADFYHDRTHLSEEEVDNTIRELIYSHGNIIFDFTTGPIFQIKLVEFSNQRFLFLFGVHHIIWDETSSMNLMQELNVLYNSYATGQEPDLPAKEIDYVDYAHWMNDSLKNGHFAGYREYWLKKFEVIPPGLDLPTDFPRPAIQTFNGGTVLSKFGEMLKKKVYDFCDQNDVTLYMVLLAVFNLHLHRLSGQKDFVVGSPIVNRDDIKLEKVLGLFASAIPLRCTLTEDMTFTSLLLETKKTAVDAYDNHLYPSNLAIEEINPEVDLSRSKLFSVMFGLQNSKNDLISDLKFHNLTMQHRLVDFEEENSRFDLTLAIDELDGDIEINFNYNTDLFKKSTAERMVNQYLLLLNQALMSPEENVAKYSMISEKEREWLLIELNQTSAPFSETVCIHQKFEEQAELSPEHVALVHGDEETTYGELNAKANQLAHYLQSIGVQIEDKVGVVLEPSREMFIALLAILKAGASYVPISPLYPTNRKEYILDRAEIKVLIGKRDFLSVELDFSGEKVLFDDPERELTNWPTTNLQTPVHSSNLAYVIFTSGTSGQPKGIEVEHKGAINLFEWTQREYPLGQTDATLLITPFTFDVSILDIFWPLTVGARVAIPGAGERENPAAIGKLVNQHQVTILQFVPIMLEAFIDAYRNGEFAKPASLKYVICAGSILTKKLRDKFYQFFDAEFSNHYGPTEATVDVTYFNCANAVEGDIVPIGKPLSNKKVYILDAYLQPVPVGVVGEIYIESVGLARGYLQDEEKTRTAFIQNPFSSHPGGRLYKTGDLGKVLEDGNIICIGRADNQVKIRGNRVELEEIENQLTNYPAIKKAAVVLKKFEQVGERLLSYLELDSQVTGLAHNEEVYQIYTVSQMKELREEIDKIHVDAWPAYFAGDAIHQTYWSQIYTRYPEYQFCLINREGNVVGAGNSVPIYWDGTVENIPAGWDQGLQQAFMHSEKAPNTLLILAGVVSPDFRDQGISSLLVKAFKQIGFGHHLQTNLVPVRPTGKRYHPEMSFEEWCSLRREDGLPVDNWLRVHERLGGRVLKVETRSQYIRGSIGEWEEWTGQRYTRSGEYHLADSLQPVFINCEEGYGEYYDPSVWMEHPFFEDEKLFWTYIDETVVKNYLKEYVPDYMIPDQIVFIDPMPLTQSGKIDKNRLPELHLQAGSTGYVPPQNEVEERIAKIWSQILTIEKIGRSDHFFKIGGHSLKATQVMTKINHEFGTKISLRELFKNPTIEDLAICIKEQIQFEGKEDMVENKDKGFIRPFDLSQGPLIRAELVATKPDEHLFLLDMHHVISDATSVGILIEEFTYLYAGNELQPLQLQYKDYSEWERSLQNIQEVNKQEEYWLNLFNGHIPKLDLPFDFERPEEMTFEGRLYEFTLDKEVSNRISLLKVNEEVSTFMILFAAYNILLHKYTQQEDIIVGTPVAGRQISGVENMIGMFVNTLALRNQPVKSKTLLEFVLDVREKTFTAFENQLYQFEKLVEKLNISREANRNPLFDTLFVLQNVEESNLDSLGFELEPYDFQQRIAKFDLSLIAREVNGEFIFNFEYNTDLFKEETIKGFANDYVTIVTQIAQKPDQKIENIDLAMGRKSAVGLTLEQQESRAGERVEADREKILTEFNHSLPSERTDRVLKDLFEEKASLAAENVALVMKGETIRYRELNEKANQLARFLRTKGVKPETIVGILVEPSIDMMIGLLAIIKAGGAYLPIKPDVPWNRMNLMLNECQCGLLLTVSTAQIGSITGIEQIELDNPAMYAGDPANLETLSHPADLLTLIYTSGSTGKPKGVLIEQRTVVNTLTYLQKEYPVTENDSYLFKTQLTFDVSMTEVFGWFMGTGKLVILGSDEYNDTAKICEAIRVNQVTHANFVPSMLKQLLNSAEKEDLKALENLKYVFVAGEILSLGVARRFYDFVQGVRLENLYGPTEASIYVTGFSVDQLKDETTIPIGKPFDHCRIYIMDENMELVPIGVPGELYIAGDCLARGYLNDPELTMQKFIPDPFVPGKTMYKTGDQGKWLANGNIQFLGRDDQQIKLNGLRIELGEIETVFVQHSEIQDGAIALKFDSFGNKYICAYYVARNDLSVPELREYLSEYLPDYMIPAYFMRLEQIPVSANGKRDVKNLPELAKINMNIEEYKAPQGELELALYKIWSRLLNVDHFGVNDHFLHLGGDSLKANYMANYIKKELNYKVEVKDIFLNSTIAKLAQWIKGLEPVESTVIPQAEEKDYYPASSTQKRMYLLHQMSEEDLSYNMPYVLILRGEVDPERFSGVFQKIIQRHESLRTSFHIVDGEIVQKIDPEVDFQVKYWRTEETDYEKIIQGQAKAQVEEKPASQIVFKKQARRRKG